MNTTQIYRNGNQKMKRERWDMKPCDNCINALVQYVPKLFEVELK